VVRNNIFAFNRENQLMRSREEAHTSFFFTNNIVAFDSGNLLGSTWKNDQFIINGNLYWDKRAVADPASVKFSGAALGTMEGTRPRHELPSSLTRDSWMHRRMTSVSAVAHRRRSWASNRLICATSE
jgi:hypothetical protein